MPPIYDNQIDYNHQYNIQLQLLLLNPNVANYINTYKQVRSRLIVSSYVVKNIVPVNLMVTNKGFTISLS
jgi:hypothetical protein